LLQSYPRSRNSSVFGGVLSPYIEKETTSIYTRRERAKEGGLFTSAPKIHLEKKGDYIIFFFHLEIT
jgi:hypothetical protein